MTVPDIAPLVRQLRTLINEAWTSVGAYGQKTLYSNISQDEEMQYLQGVLGTQMERIFNHLCFCLEALGLKTNLENFLEGFKQFQNDPLALEMIPYVGELTCPALAFMDHFALSFDAYLPTEGSRDERPEKQLLERILNGTGKLVQDQALDPSSEVDVRAAIYGFLIHAFPDTVRDPEIARVSKSFKPDFGIPSLRTGVEYKFVDSPDELKVAISGIFEDVTGYTSRDWTCFYSVIYMTNHFMTRDQLDAEFNLAQISDRWTPILIVGRGGRTRNARRS